MKPSLRFVRFLAVRDERMISHAGCRNAYTNTFPPPGPHKRRGKKCKHVTEIGTDQCTQTVLANKHRHRHTKLQQHSPRMHDVMLFLKKKKLYLTLKLSLFSLFHWQSCSSLNNPSLKSFHYDQAAQPQYFLCNDGRSIDAFDFHSHLNTLITGLRLWIKLIKLSPRATLSCV